MSSLLKFGTTKKSRIEIIRKEKTINCRKICMCSLTSTIHLLIPMLKVLNRLGTVQVISEDKSVMLLGQELNDEFEIADMKFTVVSEIVMVDDDVFNSMNDYDFNIVITHDFVPNINFDKYVILNRRDVYREQITTPQQRYTPIVSVFNQQGFSKEEIEREKGNIFVNERLITLPPFAVCQDYLTALLQGKHSTDYKVNAKLIEFVTEMLTGIEECSKHHVKQILIEKSDMFVNPS